MAIDTTKSIAELTGVDWGPPPEEASCVVKDRHVWRRQQVATLPDAALIRFLKMSSDTDLVVRIALERMDAMGGGLDASVGLVAAVLGERDFPWSENPELIARMRRYVSSAISGLGEWDGNASVVEEANQWRCTLYRLWVEFELPLSRFGGKHAS